MFTRFVSFWLTMKSWVKVHTCFNGEGNFPQAKIKLRV